MPGQTHLDVGTAHQKIAEDLEKRFDLTRNALSVLENGDLGWIQISSFLLNGLLFVLRAVGMWHALGGSRGAALGPRLFAVMGVGLIGAAFFQADPGLGFPPGMPVEATTLSWHGLGHLLVSTLAFLSLIATCFAFVRRFAAQRLRGWAIYSGVTGVLSFVTLAGLPSGHLWMISVFVFAMLKALVWVSVMAVRLVIGRSRASA